MTDDPRLFLERQGYRRCDIPACNCGSWHGGHANARLTEIREAFEQDELTDTRNKTLLNLVCEVLEDRADYKLRAERTENELAMVKDDFDRAIMQRDVARVETIKQAAMFQMAVMQLVRIKSFVHIEGIMVEGKGYSFHPPDALVREAWEALSKAIREIDVQALAGEE